MNTQFSEINYFSYKNDKEIYLNLSPWVTFKDVMNVPQVQPFGGPSDRTISILIISRTYTLS